MIVLMGTAIFLHVESMCNFREFLFDLVINQSVGKTTAFNDFVTNLHAHIPGKQVVHNYNFIIIVEQVGCGSLV